MAIQFPDNLVIADRVEVEEVDPEPWPERNLFSVHRIKVPVDFRSEIQVLVSQ